MTATPSTQGFDPRFAAAWKESRRRWRRFLVCWLGGPVALIVTLMALGLVLPDALLNALVLPGALVWMVGSAILAFRLAGLECPRCGEPFYLRGLYGNLLTRRCLHCGLPKGAPSATMR